MDKVIGKYKIMYNTDKRWLMMTTIAVSLVWGILDSQPVSADVVPDAGAEQEKVVVDSDGDDQSVRLTGPVVDGNRQSDVSKNDKPETESPVEEKTGTDNSVSVLPDEENEEESHEQVDSTLLMPKVDQDEATSESQLSEVNGQKKDKLRVLSKRDTVVNEPQQNDVHKTQQSVQAKPTSTVVIQQARTSAQSLIDNWMPNEKLQELVWKELTAANDTRNSRVFNSGRHWETAKDITQSDLKLLDDLDLAAYGTTYIDGKHSFSLEGLEYATNLKRLDVSNDLRYEPYAIRGDVTDLTPLKNLVNLESLSFAGNRVSDITPITGLKNIEELIFTGNKVADFSSLNVAQYIKNLSIGEQFVERSLIYIPLTENYEFVNPVKAPQGWKIQKQEKSGTTNILMLTMLDATSIKNGVGRIFWAGALTDIDGDKLIVVSPARKQIPIGPQVNPIPDRVETILQEKYTYFLNWALTFSGNRAGKADIRLVMPYMQSERAQNVTVNYINEAGKNLADPEILDGFIGEKYQATIKEFAGYHHDHPDNAEGIFSKDSQTVTFNYFKDKLKPVTPPVTPPHPVQIGTVTVHYQTTTGTTVAPDMVFTGNVGNSYNTKPAANVSADYELTTTPANANGVFSNGQITVTYLYDKVATAGSGDGSKPTPTPEPTPTPQPSQQPAEPDVNSGQPDDQAGTNLAATAEMPAQSGAAVQVTPAKTATKPINSGTQATLPKTNDKPTSPFWGMTILWLLLGLVGVKHRKH